MFPFDLFCNKKLKYDVIGAGSVGGTISAFLKSGNKDVRLITKYPHLVEAAKKQKGVRLISTVKGDKIYNVNVVDENNIGKRKSDVIFLCVRTPDIKSTFPLIRKLAHKNTIVMSISNGFGIADELQKKLPEVNVIESSFVGMSRWFERETPTYLHQREYCELKLAVSGSNPIDEKILKQFEKDILEVGMSGGFISLSEMKTLLFERLITRSPFESCCLLYDITANEIVDEKAVLFRALCDELVLLAKAMKINLRNDFVDEYIKNFDEYKKRDDANVVSSILTDIKRGQKPEIDFFLFIVETLAKEHNINLPKYFEIAEKFRQHKNFD